MPDDDLQQFVADLTGMQPRLRAYVLTLLGDADAADEVLQQTNVTLWNKRDDFEPGTNFVAWALTVARYETLAYRKRRKLDRLEFSDALVDRLAVAAADRVREGDDRRSALRSCLDELPNDRRELIERYYSGLTSVEALAETLRRTESGVYQLMYRLRRALAECVQRRMEATS